MTDPTPTTYMYIFVRKDLSKEQIAVQSCHAAVEASRHYLDPIVQHPSLVILQVANEEELEAVTLYLSENGIKCKGFYEEFYNNSLTAIATEIISGERRACLRKYQLLSLRE